MTGLVLRFRYHVGLLARPPNDAGRITRSPSRRYNVGVVRGLPDLRPTVVTRAAGNHSNRAPSRPLVRRYTQIWARAKYFSTRARKRELRNPCGTLSRLRVADDDRDRAVGPGLVVLVGRVHLHQLRPVVGALLVGRVARRKVQHLFFNL